MNLENLNLDNAHHARAQLEAFGEFAYHMPGEFMKMTAEECPHGVTIFREHVLTYDILSIHDSIVGVCCMVADDNGPSIINNPDVAVVGPVCCEVERGRLAQELLKTCQVHGDVTPDLGIIMDWLGDIANEIEHYSDAFMDYDDDDEGTDDSPDLPDDPGPVVKIKPDEPKTSKATIPPRISMSKVLETAAVAE